MHKTDTNNQSVPVHVFDVYILTACLFDVISFCQKIMKLFTIFTQCINVVQTLDNMSLIKNIRTCQCPHSTLYLQITRVLRQ